MKRKTTEEIEEKSPQEMVREWLHILILAILLTLLLRAFVFQGYRISNKSMEDTFRVGDYIIGEKISYKTRLPKPGEIVIFEYPLNPDKIFIKRCVALPGDTVVIRNKILYINNQPATEYSGVKYTDPELLSAIYSNRDNYGPVIIPADNIFVIGDNRDNSMDSRFWGPLPVENIQARPLFIYFSIQPDENTPVWRSPLSIIPIIIHYITSFPSRIRGNRIGRQIV